MVEYRSTKRDSYQVRGWPLISAIEECYVNYTCSMIIYLGGFLSTFIQELSAISSHKHRKPRRENSVLFMGQGKKRGGEKSSYLPFHPGLDASLTRS